MSGIYRVDIIENAEELKQMLAEQKTARGKERVQLLYLLSTRQAKTISHAAQLLGRNRATLHKWIQQYKNQGMEGLLTQKHSPGRPRAIPKWAESSLAKRLQDPQGFKSYQEIVEWVEENLGITAPYKTIHKLVHYRLQAAPKVARPLQIAQSQPQMEAFKKNSQKT